MRSTLTLVGIVALAAAAAAAEPIIPMRFASCEHGHPHIINIQMFGANTSSVTWPGASTTFVFHDGVNNLPSLPNVEAGSDPRTACNNGAGQWTAVSQLAYADGGTTTTADAANDGVNLVTFANTAANNSAVGGAVAVALQFFNSNFEFVDVDIVFNSSLNFSTLGTSNRYDIESVACHEFGHAFGLNHSPVGSATMFPFVGQGDIHQRSLSLDDEAGIKTLYPSFDHFWSTGSITGTIMRNGSPLYGAHVVARSLVDGVVYAGAMSFPDGTYAIEGLPTGPYYVYAEPMDGPISDANVTSTFFTTGKDTTFQTTLFGGNTTPIPVQVQPASVTGSIDITVPMAAATKNLTLIEDVTGATVISLDAVGFEVPAGSMVLVAIGGTDVLTTADSAFSMPGLGTTLGPASTGGGTVGMDSFKIFPLVVAGDAPPGPRDIVMDDGGGEVVVFSGGIDIVAPASPPAAAFMYGSGSSGTAGTPMLTGNGQPTLGNPYSVTVSNGVDGEVVYIFFSADADFIDGGNGRVQYIRVPLSNIYPGGVFGMTLANGGMASYAMMIPSLPSLAGFRAYGQAALSDQADPNGFSSTNALLLILN